MAQGLFAIQLSRESAQVVEINSSMRRTLVQSVFSIKLDPEASQEERWSTIKAELPHDPETLIVGIEGDLVSTRELSFPFVDAKKIEAALDFELESLIPFDLEDVWATWTITDRSSEGASVLAAVVSRERLTERLDAIEAVELEARSVALPAACLAELAPDQEESDEPFALVSLGEECSELVVLRNGLRYARTIRTGGVAIDRQIARHYKIELAQAREAREREAQWVHDIELVTPALATLSTQVELGLRPLARELSATFGGLRPIDQPRKIYLTGPLAKLKGIADYFARKFGIEVEILDLSTVLEKLSGTQTESFPTVEGIDPEYASTLGLALAQLKRGSHAPLNFRRGEFAYSGDFALYRTEILRFAFGIAAVLLIALLGSFIRLSVLNAEEDRIDQGFCDATKKIIGTEICNAQRALARLNEPSNATNGVVIPVYSATHLLNTMSGLLAPHPDVSFDSLEFRVNGRADEPDQVTGTGEAKDFETIQTTVSSLKKDPCIEKAEVTRQRRTRDSGRVEFSIEVNVQCAAGVQPGSALAATE